MASISLLRFSSRRHIIGCFLLMIANTLWVLAAEIAKYLYVDLNFKRPFQATYIKLCMMLTYFLPYLWKYISNQNYENYGKVSDEAEVADNSLSPAEFELIPVDDSDLCDTPRRVRFSKVREVRHMPARLAEEAKRARIPDRIPSRKCHHSFVKYSFLLSTLWIICTLTYQLSLLFATVSSVNLVSASSSVFVLILSALLIPAPDHRITSCKFLLILSNLVGVGLVSEYSTSLIGISLALLSAFFYAFYLVSISYYQNVGYHIDVSFIFGLIGLLALLFYSPFLLVLDYLYVEPLFPLPDKMQLSMLILNGLVGSVFSDILWLYATLLTSPIAGAVSLSAGIPLSLLADALFRGQSPSSVQLIAVIPIMISFIGTTFLNSEINYKDDDVSVLEEAQSLMKEINDESDELSCDDDEICS